MEKNIPLRTLCEIPAPTAIRAEDVAAHFLAVEIESEARRVYEYVGPQDWHAGAWHTECGNVLIVAADDDTLRAALIDGGTADLPHDVYNRIAEMHDIAAIIPPMASSNILSNRYALNARGIDIRDVIEEAIEAGYMISAMGEIVDADGEACVYVEAGTWVGPKFAWNAATLDSMTNAMHDVSHDGAQAVFEKFLQLFEDKTGVAFDFDTYEDHELLEVVDAGDAGIFLASAYDEIGPATTDDEIETMAEQIEEECRTMGTRLDLDIAQSLRECRDEKAAEAEAEEEEEGEDDFEAASAARVWMRKMVPSKGVKVSDKAFILEAISANSHRSICNLVREFFNVAEADIDADGDIWICNPCNGSWLDDDRRADFLVSYGAAAFEEVHADLMERRG